MRVYVVSGSPLSGKTSYVNKHKGVNDLIYDYDLIMSAISGKEVHCHNNNLIDYVMDIQETLINRLKQEIKIDNAWIVTTKVNGSLKKSLAGLSPIYINLDIDINDAKKRLRDNPGNRDIDVWDAVIDSYFADRSFYKSIEYYNNENLYNKVREGDTAYFYTSWTWRKKRKQIIERDNNECQICKEKGRVTVGTRDNPLHVHHIKHLKKRVDLALDDENLVTVCKPCHEGEHPEIYKKETDNVEEMFPERWE